MRIKKNSSKRKRQKYRNLVKLIIALTFFTLTIIPKLQFNSIHPELDKKESYQTAKGGEVIYCLVCNNAQITGITEAEMIQLRDNMKNKERLKKVRGNDFFTITLKKGEKVTTCPVCGYSLIERI